MQGSIIYSITGIAATILSVVAFIPYIQSILKNKTRPSSASWWTWALLAFITVISSRAAGAPWAVLILPIWLCLSQLAVAILSLKRGDNNWDRLNQFCIAGALAGTLLWIVTGEPLIALLVSIVADFLASVPNWRHVFKNPEQENRLGWTLGWGSAVLEIFTIRNWTLAESGWAIYFLVSISVTLLLIYRPTFKKSK